ncbi:MAG: PTS sugar transporter subunit IIA [Planctomycetota bacterium]|jgi:PTS system nitrogen regulatory IIA component
MRFSKHVKKKNVFCSLDSGDRESAIREMVRLLTESGEIPKKVVDALIDGLLTRERLGSTGIGKGVAIPHVRLEGFDKLLIAVGRSEPGVDFSAVDGEMVRVIFLIISAEDKQEEYLEALRWVSRVARDDYHNKLLLGATTAAGFVQLFQDIEESL